MATFNANHKSSEASFTTQSKDADAWTEQQHSDIDAAGMDAQVMDSTVTSMDEAGNVIATQWTIAIKETI